MPVLLAEDDRELAELVKAYLDKRGFCVQVETQGDRVMAVFAAVASAIVILDIRLPNLDGLTVCKRLRQEFDGPILPGSYP